MLIATPEVRIQADPRPKPLVPRPLPLAPCPLPLSLTPLSISDVGPMFATRTETLCLVCVALAYSLPRAGRIAPFCTHPRFPSETPDTRLFHF